MSARSDILWETQLTAKRWFQKEKHNWLEKKKNKYSQSSSLQSYSIKTSVRLWKKRREPKGSPRGNTDEGGLTKSLLRWHRMKKNRLTKRSGFKLYWRARGDRLLWGILPWRVWRRRRRWLWRNPLWRTGVQDPFFGSIYNSFAPRVSSRHQRSRISTPQSQSSHPKSSTKVSDGQSGRLTKNAS